MKIVAQNPNDFYAQGGDAEAPTHQRVGQEGPFVWFEDIQMFGLDNIPAGHVVLSADLIREAARRIEAGELDTLPSNVSEGLESPEQSRERIWRRNAERKGVPYAPSLPALAVPEDERPGAIPRPLEVPGEKPGEWVEADTAESVQADRDDEEALEI